MGNATSSADVVDTTYPPEKQDIPSSPDSELPEHGLPVHPLPVDDADADERGEDGGGDGQGLDGPPENQDMFSSPDSELPEDGLVHPLQVDDADASKWGEGGGGDGRGLDDPPENQGSSEIFFAWAITIPPSPDSELSEESECGFIHPLQVDDTGADERGEGGGGDGRGLDGKCEKYADAIAGEPAHDVAISSSSISSHKTFLITCGGFSIIALLHVFWFVMIGALGRHGWDVNNFPHGEKEIFALLTILLPFFDFIAAVVGVQEFLKRQDQVKVMLPSTPSGKDITHKLE